MITVRRPQEIHHATGDIENGIVLNAKDTEVLLVETML